MIFSAFMLSGIVILKKKSKEKNHNKMWKSLLITSLNIPQKAFVYQFDCEGYLGEKMSCILMSVLYFAWLH